MNGCPDPASDVFDLDRLAASGFSEGQAAWMLARTCHTGHDGRPVIVGADAVEMFRRQLPAELRDDGEALAP